jgi:cell division septation protein DedD
MSDEGFHEIQLNGKQLVFLFITVTVVSVVIFLCGVLVGRGVRAERASASAAVDSSVAPVPETPEPIARPAPDQRASAQAATTDPATAAPPPADDELSYYKRLEGNKPPDEKLKPTPPPSTTPPPSMLAELKPAPAPPAAGARTKSGAAATTGEPAGPGFAVQIAALRDRGEADAVVKRLTGKGYPAYILAPPAGGAAAVYRVRVGKFKNRREAEDVASRLEKEEQFRPWILR